VYRKLSKLKKDAQYKPIVNRIFQKEYVMVILYVSANKLPRYWSEEETAQLISNLKKYKGNAAELAHIFPQYTAVQVWIIHMFLMYNSLY
jgi:hypothetical protein